MICMIMARGSGWREGQGVARGSGWREGQGGERIRVRDLGWRETLTLSLASLLCFYTRVPVRREPSEVTRNNDQKV